MNAVHKIKKVVIEANVFYIRSGKQDQVRLRPTLAGSEVPTDTTKAQLLGKRQEVLDVWVTYFNAVSERELKEAEGATPRSSHGTTDDSWAKVMLPTLAELSQARANISTPRRLKLGEMLSTFSETLPAPLWCGFEKIEELSDNMDVNPMDRLQEMGTEWKKMVKNFDILESEHQI
jgi:hypothetical protein